MSEARTLTAKLANDARDEDRKGGLGLREQGAARAPFRRPDGLAGLCQLAAAEGAVDAYGAITGETWKPYVAPPETQPFDQQAAAAELEAFGA